MLDGRGPVQLQWSDLLVMDGLVRAVFRAFALSWIVVFGERIQKPLLTNKKILFTRRVGFFENARFRHLFCRWLA